MSPLADSTLAAAPLSQGQTVGIVVVLAVFALGSLLRRIVKLALLAAVVAAVVVLVHNR